MNTHSATLKNRREYERKPVQVIVHFNFRGQEKVYETLSLNLSPISIFIQAEREVLNLMLTGESVVAMVEFQKNLFIRLSGYVVRLDLIAESSGFAMKFLELDETQKRILANLMIQEHRFRDTMNV